MDVSVVTTTYNGLPFLVQAIQSVLRQSLTQFEYVIVDDGSSDDTPAAMASITDPRVRYVQLPRIGRAAALNAALQEARGKYVANLDADDLMLPERLAMQTLYLDCHDDVGMVGSAYLLRRLDGSETAVALPTADADLRKRLYVGYPFAHSAVTYRRETLIRSGGFDQTLACSIDYDACARVALRASLANLAQPLVVRRVHKDNYFMRHISPRQYISALGRIKWRYWRGTGYPARYVPLMVASVASAGARKLWER